jgi:tetraacyldisaccharide 4'-kinase
MSSWRKILWPLVPVYALITGLRNKLFDLGILHSQSFQTPLIVVGNLSTGGSGKTPMTEFLLQRLRKHDPGFVSRGYGRRTKGLQMVSTKATAKQIGDEPWQIMQKFPGLKAAVAEKRAEGVKALIEAKKPGVIVLDDAFQHRYVKGDLNILLTTWQQPYFRDYLLPAGNLREGAQAIKRADLIVVTKCPGSLKKDESTSFSKQLKAGDTPVFFATVEYAQLVNGAGEELTPDGRKVNLITGIAYSKGLVEKLSTQFSMVKHWNFRDHHNFSEDELSQFEASKHSIITTEKDWSRLKDRVSEDLARRIYRWPIVMKILFDEEARFMREIDRVFHRPHQD